MRGHGWAAVLSLTFHGALLLWAMGHAATPIPPPSIAGNPSIPLRLVTLASGRQLSLPGSLPPAQAPAPLKEKAPRQLMAPPSQGLSQNTSDATSPGAQAPPSSPLANAPVQQSTPSAGSQPNPSQGSGVETKGGRDEGGAADPFQKPTLGQNQGGTADGLSPLLPCQHLLLPPTLRGKGFFPRTYRLTFRQMENTADYDLLSVAPHNHEGQPWLDAKVALLFAQCFAREGVKGSPSLKRHFQQTGQDTCAASGCQMVIELKEQLGP